VRPTVPATALGKLPQLEPRERCSAGREEQIVQLAPVLGAIWCAARTIPRREPDGASGSRRIRQYGLADWRSL
jgi:hypothetical protein